MLASGRIGDKMEKKRIDVYDSGVIIGCFYVDRDSSDEEIEKAFDEYKDNRFEWSEGEEI